MEKQQQAQIITQKKHKIWLDCDPGHDDMLAIILAALHQDCDLIGISTSAGNSTIENTTYNTLCILQEIARTDIQVYQGSPGPICSRLNTAPDIHGKTGLQGATLKKATKEAIQYNSLYRVYTKIMNEKQPINFVVTGAMTNLSIILLAFPQIKQKIKKITIMGGAIGLGNWSPAAQFNILVDPEAACIVFKCGLPIVMVPLEVTHTVLINQQIFAALKQMKSSFSDKLVDLFRYFQVKYKQNQNFDYPVAHDPCTIYHILKSQDFKGRNAFVQIQLQGKSRGRTNCQFHTKKYNAFVCQQIKVNKFWQVMLQCIQKIK